MAARKKKETSNAVEVVEGVTLAKVKPGVFNAAYLAALEVQKVKKSAGKVPLPPDGTPLNERVRALVLWNRATTDVDKLTGCSECGGDSSIELDMCPFCGDHEIVDPEGNVVMKELPLEAADEGNDEVTEEEPVPTLGDGTVAATPEELAGAQTPQTDPQPAPAASSPQGEPAAAPPPGPKRTKKPRQAGAQAPAGAPPADPPAPPQGPAVPTAADPLPPPPKGGRKLRSAGRATIAAEHDALDQQAADAMARDRDPPEPEAAPTELVTSPEQPAAGYSVGDLDKSVKLITDLKRDTANSLWKLGQAVKEVLDNRLWMLRTDQQGAPKYRTFKQFVVGELDMSYMQAHRLVQVSEGFTEEEMHKIGVSKCHVMLQVPKDKRAGLLSSAERGATMTQISNEVAKLTQNERPKPPTRTAPPLTVAMAQGRVELPLFARPKGRHGFASEGAQKANPRPAMSITDDPFCVEMLPNEVMVTYNVAKNLDGSWVLIVQRRRAKESELFQDEAEESEEEDES